MATGRRSVVAMSLALLALPALVVACGGAASGAGVRSAEGSRGTVPAPSGQEAVDARCALPSTPRVLHDGDGAVLLVWELPDDPVYHDDVLPSDPGFLAYRAAVRADGADVVRPVSDPPEPGSPEEARVWEDEAFNNDLVFSGEVGSVGPVTCLDALLFAHQNRRVAQLERPTEFIASVLQRDVEGRSRLAVVFGAGREMFVPKAVYGFDVAERYREEGWRLRYVLHNHTLQRNGERLALGTPAPSTSDVGLARNLVESLGMEAVRVTNGFFTFHAAADELEALRAR